MASSLPDGMLHPMQLIPFVQIDVQPIDARPDKGEPAHMHFDVRYVFRTQGTPKVTLQPDEVAGAEWCGPSQLGDPVLRTRVLSVLEDPQGGRPIRDTAR